MPAGAVRRSEVSLEGVPFSQVVIEDAPADDDERLDMRVVLGNREGGETEVRGIRLRLARDKLRTSTITDMAFVDGMLLVAGTTLHGLPPKRCVPGQAMRLPHRGLGLVGQNHAGEHCEGSRSAVGLGGRNAVEVAAGRAISAPREGKRDLQVARGGDPPR